MAGDFLAQNSTAFGLVGLGEAATVDLYYCTFDQSVFTFDRRRRRTLSFDAQPVIFDHGIREQVAANFVQGAFADGAIHFQLDKFSHPHRGHAFDAVMADRVAHGDALRIENVLFWRHDDLGFHGGGD